MLIIVCDTRGHSVLLEIKGGPGYITTFPHRRRLLKFAAFRNFSSSFKSGCLMEKGGKCRAWKDSRLSNWKMSLWFDQGI